MDREGIARFLSEQTAGFMPVERTLDVITNVVSGPDAVRELCRAGARVAVGVVIDACSSAARAAELSLFCGQKDEALLDELLAWALARLAASTHENLDVPRWPGLFVPEAWLRENGFSRAYTLHEMHREGAALPEPPPPLPPGWQWRDYADPQFEGFYEALSLSFRDLPGAFVLDRELCRARVRSLAIPLQLLCRGDEVGGFVRLEVSGTSGDLAALGRHPRHRGAGLGPHLVQHGLEVVVAHGATRQLLEVAAVNDRAMSLYERFGFARDRSYDVWRRPMR